MEKAYKRKPCSEETKRKIGLANSGKKHSKETTEKNRRTSLEQFKNGMPEETKRKIGLALKGIKRTEEFKRKISNSNKGKHLSPATEFKSGKNHWNWKDGISSDKVKYRNRQESKDRKNIKAKQKRKEDFAHRINKNISRAVWGALKGKKECRHWEDLVGYTLEKLMQRLSVNFTKGMNFENYGEWHIDHKKPQSWFKYKTTEEQAFKDCWSLANLQPLWAKENIKKSNHYKV